MCFSPAAAGVGRWVKLIPRARCLFRQKRVGRDKRLLSILKVPHHVCRYAARRAHPSAAKPGGHDHAQRALSASHQFGRTAAAVQYSGRADERRRARAPRCGTRTTSIAERDKYGANSLVPGLTGWAQVNGRDELPIPVKAELDGYYAAHISFALDMKIFFKTITNVLAGRGVVEGGTQGK